MIPENVTLVVKAPNQQIEDQNVECLSSWTVKQLKSHLYQVYPSKPQPNEQKIIYSGQLLEDNVILKDVLRSYDNHFNHTMHLVCASKRSMGENSRPSKRQPETPPIQSQDGVRHRNVTATADHGQSGAVNNTNRPETRQNDQNHNVEIQNYLSSFVNNYGRMLPYYSEHLPAVSGDPASMANHMLMMQQAYMQYMQQYANLWQAGGNEIPVTQPVVTNEAPVQPPAREPPAAPPVVREDPEERQDWLDQLYTASRLAILLTFLFLYASPFRLVLVLIIMLVVYLHHIGIFRELAAPPPDVVVNNGLLLNNPRRNREQQPEANNQQPTENNQQPEENNQQPEVNNQQPEENNQQPEAADQQQNQREPAGNVTVNDNQQSLLAVTWMIFSSFFASLIPEPNN